MKTVPQGILPIQQADESREGDIRRWIEDQPGYIKILEHEKKRREEIRDGLKRALFLSELYEKKRPKAPPTSRAVSPSKKGCCGF